MAKKHGNKQKAFGLIGKNISYSFSQNYFSEKFKTEGIKNSSYQNFDLNSIEQFSELITTPNIKGLNVTIPYKEAIIPYLDKLSKKAKKIGAVNTIKLTKKGKRIGYNTDCYGFKKSLLPILKPHHKSALIFGTGGASKAVAYTLKTLDISYEFVSRKQSKIAKYNYQNLNDAIIKSHLILINCTPLGTYPNVNDCPDIPYNAITNQHILYDLIYNPEKTTFLKHGELHKATTCNGLKMLELQAEKAWCIWNA